MAQDTIPIIVSFVIISLTMTSLLHLVSATGIDERDFKDGDLKQLGRLGQLITDYLQSAREGDSGSSEMESGFYPQPALDDLTPLPVLERRSQPWHRQNKRPCNLGIFSDQCRLSELDSSMRVKNFLSGGYSPGKRSGPPATDSLDMNPDDTRRKRSCHFRLGGHCMTEALDKAARQYYYLQSASSPGRRRRSPKDSQSAVTSRGRRSAVKRGSSRRERTHKGERRQSTSNIGQ